ncbi:TMEM175 family protein [Liquorilactobacillus cacaonum]|uniref:Integral membrane protein n=1 Tax=Liquorilactobacillus cacaonum DSM 21116 TaxID=1423729 RepID=A0A0R2CG21_9LACO|nr:TMEM175 family protein [Liquorilactobacillus cacaonum]KRM90439.1 hypothetical protein FC80_GL001343 [Liquorilactobacillus cacaonum DSM 21116]
MSKSRLEAFSDGVFAIIITIMVLELKTPETASWNELIKSSFYETIFSYILSYLFVASFWISHHMIISPIKKVDRTLLWTNIALLLPISLLPLVTNWQGENIDSVAPSVCYLAIYTLSVLGLYTLGRVALKRVPDDKKQECYTENKPRFWVVLFGLIALLITFFIPFVATLSVLGILIFWLINSSK